MTLEPTGRSTATSISAAIFNGVDDGTEAIRLDPGVGDNPVFIDGQKCWRRYRFSASITRRDDHDSDSVEEFHEKHRNDV